MARLDVAARRHARQVDVVGEEDRRDPGHRAGFLDVHPQEARVRHDGANEDGPQRALDRDVVQVACPAPQEPRVFSSEHREAEHRGRHGRHRPMLSAWVARGGNEPVRRNAIAMTLALVVAACHADTSPRPEAAAGGGVKLVRVAALADPVGFTFTPNGRIVYLERDTGRVRLLNPRTGARPHPLPLHRGERRRRARGPGRGPAPRLATAAVRLRLRLACTGIGAAAQPARPPPARTRAPHRPACPPQLAHRADQPQRRPHPLRARSASSTS